MIAPYDPDRVRRRGGHALVIGASVAGLLAARVLLDAFERVTILDRDVLDTTARPRRGVPQGQHLHVLLTAGQLAMEQLAPGFTAELVAAGAVRVDLGRDVELYAERSRLAPGNSELPMYYASRPLIEDVLRRRVRAHARLTLGSGQQVTDPVLSDDGAVVGVVAVDGGGARRFPAELVVDATGRGSRTPTWLEQLGQPRPEVERVEVDLVYRTVQLRRPAGDRRAMLVMPSADLGRGAGVAPVENERWLVTLFGLHGDHPPGDPEGLRAFAAELATPEVARLLDDHPPVTPDVSRYRFPASRRHRYDRSTSSPRGLLTIGDSIASFNPIYGQGMAVAALQALTLHRTLAAADHREPADDFYARSATIVDDAWNLAAGGDFRFPGTTGPKPPGTDLLNRYVVRLHRRAQVDGELADTFSRVAAMLRRPTALLRPATVWRVIRPRRPSARARSVTDP
jgi:2-polyprenyl-6-methoxyphenol hydroxylase-like FAD-dependent oxidoreductase